jgi:predicted RNase H-like HicB family nuclease
VRGGNFRTRRAANGIRGRVYRSDDTAHSSEEQAMRTFTAVVERDPESGVYVGYVPGFPGAHSQGDTLDELNQNLQEVIEMLLEEGDPKLEAEFIGTQTVKVA